MARRFGSTGTAHPLRRTVIATVLAAAVVLPLSFTEGAHAAAPELPAMSATAPDARGEPGDCPTPGGVPLRGLAGVGAGLAWSR